MKYRTNYTLTIKLTTYELNYQQRKKKIINCCYKFDK